MTTPNAGEDVGKSAHTVGGHVKLYSHSAKQCSNFLKKPNVRLPYDPAIPFLGIYPPKMKTCVQHKKRVHECPQQLYLQSPKTGNNPDAR